MNSPPPGGPGQADPAALARLQEAIQQRMAQVEYLQTQLQEYQRQIDMVNVDLTSTITGRETLRKYQETASGDEVLLPIGGNAFVKASVAVPDQVIVGIGSDLAMEVSAEQGIARLEEKVKRLEDTMRILRGEAERIADRADTLNGEIRALYGEASAQGLV